MEDSFKTWRKSYGVDVSNTSVENSSDDEVYIPFNKKRINRILDSSEDTDISWRNRTPKMSQETSNSTPLFKSFNVLKNKENLESFVISDSEEEIQNSNKECIYISDSSSDKENIPSGSIPKTYSKKLKSNTSYNLSTSKLKENITLLSESSRDISNSESSDSEDHLDFSFKPEKKNAKRKDVTHDDTREFIKNLKANTSSDSVEDFEFDKVVDNAKIQTTQTDSEHITSSEKMDVSNGADGYDITEDSKLAISLVEEELGHNDADVLTVQKRAFLLCKEQHLKNQLAKTEVLINSDNIDFLPDKGKRIQNSIIDLKRQIEEVQTALQNLPSQYSSNRDHAHANTFQSNVDNCNLMTEESDYASSSTFERPSKFSELQLENFPSSSKTKPLGKRAQEIQEKQLSLTVDSLKELHGSLVTGPKENEFAEDPEGLKIKLMPHQKHALMWCLWRENQKPCGGILADDMGLGKTLTMISLILTTLSTDNLNKSDEWTSSHRPAKIKGGTLVVCPASLLAQWESEIKNRCKKSAISVLVYHGHNRESIPKRFQKYDVVITTYNLLSREHKTMSILFKINWKRVILDEAHVIRNYKSQASIAVCDLQSCTRWALTGTPFHNKEMDLYALFKFLRCSPFDDLRIWKQWVNNSSVSGHQRLATIMKTLMLRRTKQELLAKGGMDSLPNKLIEEIKITLSSSEKLVYQKVLVYSRTLFAQFLNQRAEKYHMKNLYAGKYDKPCYSINPNQKTEFTKAQNELLTMHAGNVEAHEILVLLLRLRQICCHPPLIHSMLDREDMQQNGLMEDEIDNANLLSQMNNVTLHELDAESDEESGIDTRVKSNILTSKNPVFDPKRICSKMRNILDKVKEILDQTNDKLIIVSQWTTLLDVVASHLSSLKGATYKKFTGQVPIKDRQGIQDSFNAPNKTPRILLLSLTAGGVGLNLVGGNHLLLIDNHWNPQLETQAQDRIYRFGQTKDVFIYKFICEETIEERIKNLQEHKLSMAQNILSGEKHMPASKLTLDDLKSLFEI